MEIRNRGRYWLQARIIDVQRLGFILPDGRFQEVNVMIVGALNFARVDKHIALGWPPQTVFVEFNAEFLRASGQMGYAKPIAMDGFLVRAYLIKGWRDREFVLQAQAKAQQLVSDNLTAWLAREHHPQIANWAQQVSRLQPAIEAYGQKGVGLEQIFARLEKLFAHAGKRQQQRVKKMINHNWDLIAAFDRKLAVRFPTGYLLREVRHVTHFMYGDERDFALKLMPNDPSLMKQADYLTQIHQQLVASKVQQATLGSSFYNPHWLATQQEFHRAVWELDQLKEFHLGGN